MLAKYFPAFAIRDFRLFWISDFIARTGTQLLTVTISWQLYLLTHSPFALGLIGVFQMVPLLMFNLIGGATADVYNRKIILYITGVLLVGTSTLLGFATAFHVISPAIIYGLIAIAAAVNAFNYPAYGAVLPAIVDKSQLTVAASTLGLQEDMSEMLGPALGGFLIALLGIGPIYFLDAFSTLISIGALFFMSYNGKPSGEKSNISFAAVKEGYHFLISKKVMWSSALLDTLTMLFASAVVLMPIFANDVLYVGVKGLGLLYAAPSVGAIIIGFFLARGIHIYHQGKVLLGAVAVFAIATIVFGISKYFPLSLLALMVLGGANLVSVTIRSVIRATFTPDNMLGRLYSFYNFFWIFGDKVGDIEGGFVAQLVGAPLATVLGGVGALVAIGCMAIFNPHLRNHTLPKAHPVS